MSSYTENIQLTLRDLSDSVDVAAFNRDNQLLDALLAPVAEDYGVLRSAARIGAYNLYKLMSVAQHNGLTVADKAALFFGDFAAAAPSAADNAQLSAADKCYFFAPDIGSSVNLNTAGDSPTTIPYGTPYSFSFTAPGCCTITSIQLDIKGDSNLPYVYLQNLTIGGKTIVSGSQIIGASPAARGTLTYNLSAPVVVYTGETLSGTIKCSSSGQTFYLYGQITGAPLIKFPCTPATQTGWIKSALTSMGSFGHSEARVYVQCQKGQDDTVSVTLADGQGTEYGLEYTEARTATTPYGAACTELCFVGPYRAQSAQLKINAAAAANGYVKLYAYGVTAL